MKNKNIAFINVSQEAALEKVVHRALVASGSHVITVSKPGDASNLLTDEKIDLFLINYDDGGEATNQLVRTLLDKRDRIPTVLVSQKKDKDHLINLFSHDRMRNLIARNGLVSEEELIITTEKLLRQDIFGMEKYLPWGIHFVEEKLSDSGKKDDHVARIGDFVRNLRCDERFIRLAEVVADELLMNAFYDAPMDDKGKPRYAHLPRTERVHLAPNEQASLLYGSDGRYFAIACRDHFGALEAKTVVSYLRKCFVQDEHQVDAKAGGAGVGFYMIFQSLNQLIINIEPGKITETMGLVDIRSTYRDTKSKSKSFNIFIKQNSG